MSEDLEDELGARSSMDRKMAELRGEVRPPAGPWVWGGAQGALPPSVIQSQEGRNQPQPWCSSLQGVGLSGSQRPEAHSHPAHCEISLG